LVFVPYSVQAVSPASGTPRIREHVLSVTSLLNEES